MIGNFCRNTPLRAYCSPQGSQDCLGGEPDCGILAAAQTRTNPTTVLFRIVSIVGDNLRMGPRGAIITTGPAFVGFVSGMDSSLVFIARRGPNHEFRVAGGGRSDSFVRDQ